MRALLVEDSLNFQRGKSPLSSMGVGGFSFDTLKPGAILISKRYFGVTEKTGKITGYNSGKLPIGKDNFILVTKVRDNADGKTKNISFKRYTSHGFTLEKIKEERQKLKDAGSKSLDWWGILSGFFSDISKAKFHFRFDILVPGFNDLDESLDFQRGMDPKKTLGLGRPFGFSKDLLDITHNNGKNSLFVRSDFVEKLKSEGIYQYGEIRLYLDDLIGRWGYRKKDYRNLDGSYKGPYSCKFRLYNRSGDLYMLQGYAGDYGFGGMQSTQKGTIGVTFRKSLYEQVYNYLMEKWAGTTNESMGFQRGGNPMTNLGIGGMSFDTLKNGTIIRSKKAFGTSLGGVIRHIDGAAKQIYAGAYLIVYDLQRLDNYYISFSYINCGGPIFYSSSEEREGKDEIFHKKARDQVKDMKNMILWKNRSGLTNKIFRIGKTKFDNMFQITDLPYES